MSVFVCWGVHSKVIYVANPWTQLKWPKMQWFRFFYLVIPDIVRPETPAIVHPCLLVRWYIVMGTYPDEPNERSDTTVLLCNFYWHIYQNLCVVRIARKENARSYNWRDGVSSITGTVGGKKLGNWLFSCCFCEPGKIQKSVLGRAGFIFITGSTMEFRCFTCASALPLSIRMEKYWWSILLHLLIFLGSFTP